MSEVVLGVVIVAVIVIACVTQPIPRDGYSGVILSMRPCLKSSCHVIRTDDYRLTVSGLDPACVAGANIVIDGSHNGAILYHCE